MGAPTAPATPPCGAAAPAEAARDASPDARRGGRSAGVVCPEELVDASSRPPRAYRRHAWLGKGGFAAVWAVRDVVTGECFAAKVVSKASLAAGNARAKLASEVALHAPLRHCRVVRFQCAFEDEQNVYLLLELCGAGHTLAHAVAARGRLPEFEAAAHAAAVLAALRYLHAHAIAHRDVKPANCLLRACAPDVPLPAGAPSCMALGDLGLAARCDAAAQRRRGGMCGTPNYLAPEMLSGAAAGTQVDVWALGALTYTLCCGAPPFAAPSVPATYDRIRAGDLRLPDHLSAAARDFIGSVLRMDPDARPSLAALAAHPFLAASVAGAVAASPLPRTPLAPLTPAQAAAAARSPGVAKTTAVAVTSPKASSPSLQASAARIAALRERIFALRLPSSPATPVAEAVPRAARARDLTPCTPASPEAASPARAAADAPGWDGLLRVTRWLDCGDRYGLGYVLTDGTVGALFLDGTRMVAPPGDAPLEYAPRRTQRRRSQHASAGSPASPASPALPASPASPAVLLRRGVEEDAAWTPELRKKARVLEHLAAKLSCAERASALAPAGAEEHAASAAAEPPGAPAAAAAAAHVRAWARGRHAAVFRLSSRAVQLCFAADASQLLLLPDGHTVWFHAGQGDPPVRHDLRALPPADEPLLRRLRYARALLARLAAGESAATAPGAEADVGLEL